MFCLTFSFCLAAGLVSSFGGVALGIGSDDVTPWSVSGGRSPSYSKCETLRISFCQKLHYNQTIYPNLLHHRTQMDAEVDLHGYSTLARANCHPDMTHFLCVLFAPVCTIIQHAIPPCRSMCTGVKKGCIGLIERFGLTWPEELNCSKFPEEGDGILCISLPKGKSKTGTVQPTGPSKAVEHTGAGGVAETAIDSEVKLHCQAAGQTLEIRKIRQSGMKCLTKSMKKLIIAECHGKRRCRVSLLPSLASSASAKCRQPGAGQLKIKYKCSKVTRSGKSHKLTLGEQVTLKCKGRREIRVTSAVFGDDKTCDTPDAYCRLSQRCNGNNTCHVTASPLQFSSGCRSSRMELRLNYECVKRPGDPVSHVYVTGSRVMSVVCPSHKRIRIVGVSNKSGAGPRDKSCRSDGVYCVVFALCNDKPRCVVPDLTFFKQRCSRNSRMQRLNVSYQCVVVSQ